MTGQAVNIMAGPASAKARAKPLLELSGRGTIGACTSYDSRQWLALLHWILQG